MQKATKKLLFVNRNSFAGRFFLSLFGGGTKSYPKAKPNGPLSEVFLFGLWPEWPTQTLTQPLVTFVCLFYQP